MLSVMITVLLTLCKVLLYPCSLMIIVLLFCVLFWHRRFSKRLLALIIVIFYFAANGVIPAGLIYWRERNILPVSQASIQSHKALIVPGGGITVSPFATTPELISYSRLLKAASIYKMAQAMGINYTVFVSGGVTSEKPVSEAEQFKTILIKLGVPSTRIIAENKSQNTFENAKFSAPLLQKQGFSAALLVTDASHMKRAMKDFAFFDITTVAAPASYPWPRVSWVPQSYNLAIMDIAIHEMTGSWEFSLKRWLQKH